MADKATKRTFDPTLDIIGRIRSEALEKGVYLLACNSLFTQGDRFFINPPLVITQDELDKGLDILHSILVGI